MKHGRAVIVALALSTLTGAAPVVRVGAVDGGIQTGSPLRLTVLTAARSESGNAAQPPFAWIDHEETVDPAAASCDRRAERLLDSGPLRPSARDFNTVHVVSLDAAGALHVLDPRNGIRGARSVAHVALGSAPAAWHWAARDGLIWIALPAVRKLVAVDVARWQVTRTLADVGPVGQLAADDVGALYALSPGTGIHRITATGATLVADSRDAVAMAAGDDGEIWSIGDGGVRWLGRRAARTIDAKLTAAAWSRRADRLVGLNEAGDLVLVARTGEVTPVRNMPAGDPGAKLWLSPAGDAAIVYRRSGRALQIANLEQAAFARTIEVDRPVGLAASDSFLFVRSEGRGETMVLPLAELARSRGGGPRWIAGGEAISTSRSGVALTASADGLSAWVDAETNLVYLYHEGMNVPSGTLRSPGPPPERLLLVGPTIRPVAPGRFEAGFQLERPGRYVAVVVGAQPRFTQCTAFSVGGTARLAPDERETRVRMASDRHQVSVGDTVPIRFTLEGSGLPAEVGLLVTDVSGTGVQQHIRAQAIGGGSFEAAVAATRPGTYLVMPDPVTLPGRLAGRPVATISVTR